MVQKKLLITTRCGIMPPVALCRITVLPRTHVWCSGRTSALLFGILSLGPPKFPRSPTQCQNSSSACFCKPPSLQVPHFFHSLQYTVISHMLTGLSDRLCWGPVGPKFVGGEFTRTATPNGAVGGSRSRWIYQGGYAE